MGTGTLPSCCCYSTPTSTPETNSTRPYLITWFQNTSYWSSVVFCFWDSLLILSSISDRTPLHHAAIWGHYEVTGLLLASNANVYARDFEYRPCLFHMFSKHDLPIFRCFVVMLFASHLLFNQRQHSLTPRRCKRALWSLRAVVELQRQLQKFFSSRQKQFKQRVTSPSLHMFLKHNLLIFLCFVCLYFAFHLLSNQRSDSLTSLRWVWTF